jgi:hypothetical protein
MSNCAASTKYYPARWNLSGLYVGYTYADELSFVDGKTKAAIDITADSFEWQILDADGTVVDTLTVGDGLTITAPNKLKFLLESPVMDTAGIYTGVMKWTRDETDEVIPLFINFIDVETLDVEAESSSDSCCCPVTSNGLTVNVSGGTTIYFNRGIAGTNADVGAYFAALPEYPNDTAARLDGLDTGDVYVYSEDTDTGIYGNIKIVTPI